MRPWLPLILILAFGCDKRVDETAAPEPGPDTEQPEDTDETTGPYHPDGYGDPAVHGLEAKTQVQACADCHGADLTGTDAALSCDSCHPSSWRTDCVFCHGGEDNTTGAPPLEISGLSEGAEAPFVAHSAHVTRGEAAAQGCEQCHVKPIDVLSAGHLFVGDSTPDAAEVDFSGGRAAEASYDGAGSCSNVYCHGYGIGGVGAVQDTDTIDGCGACHPGPGSGPSAWSQLSGRHEPHLVYNTSCEHCHDTMVDRDGNIEDASQHVDGALTLGSNHEITVDLEQGCTGVCHDEQHEARFWYE